MASVTRLGDMCTGHGSFPPRPCTSASSNVFINGKGAHREGDSWDTHCDSSPSCHDGVLSKGSSGVFVNGRQLGTVGDPISCGSVVAEGSTNVFASK